jgi:competence protein ComEC
MIAAGMAFVIGNGLLVRLPVIPDLDAIAIALPACLFGLRFRVSRCLAAFVLGGIYTYIEVNNELNRRPVGLDRTETTLTGMVSGLPSETDGITQFLFRVTEGEIAGSQVRLSWYRAKHDIEPGQIWRLQVRLSEAAGSVNFELFDYEQWLFVKRIHARGYVLTTGTPELIGQQLISIDALRHYLKKRLQVVLPDANLATFFALALGDTSFLLPADWRVLNATGTTHLLIVSGLHTGLIATLTFGLLRFLGLPLFPLVGMTIVITGCYALIAGWGLPVQRAFVMTSVYLVTLSIERNITVTSQFMLALIAVLLMDPLSSLSSGFWLSFGAVFALMAGFANRIKGDQGIRRWLGSASRAQWIVYLSLLPVLGFLNQQLPLSSFLVNLVAIPWVGFLLVPALFFGLVMLLVYEPFGIALLVICDFLVEVLWQFLSEVGGYGLIFQVPGFDIMSLCIALLGVTILLSPRGLVPRWLGILPLVMVTSPPEPLARGDLRVTFLDVGQGLSVLLETRSSVNLYDTGPRFGDRFSAANQIVLPALRRAGWAALDHLIVSHPDNDHAGGVQDILDHVSVSDVIRQGDCGRRWQSDGVRFESFGQLSPGFDSNNSSCLLSIKVHGNEIMLTGDIEEAGEYALLEYRGSPAAQAPVVLMSAPHHGSNSSSTPALLNSLAPSIIAISTGYKNRYSHPSENIMARYRNRAIRVVGTAGEGAIEFTFTDDGYDLRTARKWHPRLWRRADGD